MKVSEVSQSCPTLCDPIDCSLPGSSVHGIFQATVLKWIAISFSRGSSQPRFRTRVSHIVDRCFTIWATGEVKSYKRQGKRGWKKKISHQNTDSYMIQVLKFSDRESKITVSYIKVANEKSRQYTKRKLKTKPNKTKIDRHWKKRIKKNC